MIAIGSIDHTETIASRIKPAADASFAPLGAYMSELIADDVKTKPAER
jgi:hypothetical protein